MPNNDTRAYVKAMVQALDSKRGEDIQVLKVGDLTSIAEYFVICTANSTTQWTTLLDDARTKWNSASRPITMWYRTMWRGMTPQAGS